MGEPVDAMLYVSHLPPDKRTAEMSDTARRLRTGGRQTRVRFLDALQR